MMTEGPAPWAAGGRRRTTGQERQTKTTLKQWTGERGMEEDDGGGDK